MASFPETSVVQNISGKSRNGPLKRTDPNALNASSLLPPAVNPAKIKMKLFMIHRLAIASFSQSDNSMADKKVPVQNSAKNPNAISHKLRPAFVRYYI